MRILVADDDRAIRLAVQMAVEDLGHECIVAADGESAWDLYQQSGADAIISDWRMPGLEGPDLCRLVRRQTDAPYVYFMLLTVLNDSRHVVQGMEAGADDYLTKPFTVDALHARLIAAERVTGLHRRLAQQRAESVHLADERQKLLEQLEQERGRLQAVLQQLPAGVVIAAAPDGTILMTNDQVQRIWRHRLTEPTIFGHQCQGFRLDGRPYRSEEWPLARAISSGEIVTAEEIDVIRGDGTRGTFRHSVAPIYSGEQLVAGVMVIEDVTEERRRQRESVQGEKLRALGQMASGVAHDLNQSLALVSGYAEIARTALNAAKPADPMEIGEMLSIISQAAYDGGETVKRLLTFGRGAVDGAAEAVDIGVLLDDVAKLTAPRWRDAAQAEGRPIGLRVQADAGSVVEGWPFSLREALINLVFNAVDALEDGGSIDLRAHTHESTVTVEVVDSGIGMPVDVQARIFEPYFTTKGAQGTGLGLPMAFGIVERHGGSVAVESAPGQGTTIRLTLPLRTAGPAPAAPAVEIDGGARRILVVDDLQPIRRMVARILAEQGHEVVDVGTGEEALERLTTQPFDVVLSDLGLGEGINGWQLATEIRARWPAIRVVLGTGWAASIEPEAARELGIAAILAKPYRSADLARAIESL
jgi:signal transduction histidine kinase